MSTLEKTRIFVVEDQPQLLKNLLKVLALFPELEVVGTSQEGEDGVEQMVKLLPDLVLLDLELPGIDGIEVTKRLKRRAPGVEVLILTSFDDEQKVYEAIQAGASGYLVKRVGPDKIRSGIHDVMAGGTVLEAIIAKRFWNYFQSVQAKKAQPENTWGLSPLEFDVLKFVAKGLSNAEVGRVMELERRTVRTHLSHIYRKMGVNSHVDAVVMALKAGIVEL
ncbi:MAG: response regulator transcription factor [Archangium sp.]|nr:response regulator transcription factor [Archangium sp.]MDP3570940.1 response regulator transcription factor [Archangium sp.]